MSPRASALLRAAAAAALLASPGAAAAADSWPEVFPRDASARGREVDELFWLATTLTGIAFAAVVAILVYAAVAFRARAGRRARYDTGESPRAKWVTGAFAVVVFVGLDVVLAVKDHRAWEALYGDRASLDATNSMEVQCLAKQFEWLFRYPGKDGKFGTADDVRSPVLHVPDDVPTVVRLRSIDVIHSFFLPNWRTKQDALPGMTTTSVIHPRKGETGDFDVACAELCGMGHYRMKGRLSVRSRADFDAWMRSQEKDIAEFGAMTDGEEFWAIYAARSAKDRKP